MAIAPLIVGVRTTGAAALGRLSGNFLRLGASVRVASAAAQNSFISRGGFPAALRRIGAQLRGMPGNVLRLGASFRVLAGSVGRATRALVMYALASRLAQAASSGLAKGFSVLLPLLAKWVAIGAAAVVVGLPLVGVIGNLIPLVELMAPAAGAAALAFGTLKLATIGFSDALQAGLSGDAEEFEKALKKLSFSAVLAVRTLVDLRREWKGTQAKVQESFFSGFREDAIAVSRALQPLADKWLPKIASSFATVRTQLAQGFAKFLQSTDGEAVFRNLASAIDNVLRAVAPVAQAFKDVLYVAAPRFEKLTSTVLSLATQFGDWISKARDSGKLGEWLDRAISTFGQLKDITANVLSTLNAIFKASSDDGAGMLDQIEQSTRRIAEWANSGEGQGVINFLSGVLSLLGQVAPVFSLWATWFNGIVGAAKLAWTGITAIFRTAIALWLGYLEMIVVGAAKAFGWIPGIGPKLKQAQAEFEAFKNGVNRALDGIQDETVNITYHSRVVGERLMSGSQLSGTYSSGIGGRASGGPMRAGVTYRVNEQGQEFIQLGTSGRAYNARESAAMANPAGGVGASWSGGMSGLDAMFFRWLQAAIRTGQLKLT